jgi:hexosaminidase
MHDRGILIVPKLMYRDMLRTLTAYPEIGIKVSDSKVSYEAQRNSGISTTLDPTNPKTYEILNSIFDEVYPLFPVVTSILVVMRTMVLKWNVNPAIQQFMKENSI